MSKLLKEGSVADMTKEELKKLIKDIVQNEIEKKFTKEKEEEIRKMVKGMMRRHYYTLWQKAPFFIDVM